MMNPKTRASGNDEIYTPEWVVDDMLSHFKPTGKILEPCRGGGAFTDKIPDCLWCEINEGKDFFDWHEKVDWVITNPPFSKIRKFALHSLKISDNVVFLVPVWKSFMAYGFLESLREYGGMKHIRWYGTGSKLGFPMGNAIGAIYYKRNYNGPTEFSFYDK